MRKAGLEGAFYMLTLLPDPDHLMGHFSENDPEIAFLMSEVAQSYYDIFTAQTKVAPNTLTGDLMHIRQKVQSAAEEAT